jgi:hypothetical protein
VVVRSSCAFRSASVPEAMPTPEKWMISNVVFDGLSWTG